MEKIKSITEAFSQQPNNFQITSQESYDRLIKGYMKENACKEIKLETMRVDSDKQCDFYVGYGFDGKKLFEYLRSSVNVNYEPEQ